MNAVDEYPNLDDVVDRLGARFPSLPVEHLRHVVDVERRRLRNGTLREASLPLIEEAATEELRKRADPVRLRDGVRSPAPGPFPEDPPALDPTDRAGRKRTEYGGVLLSDLDGGVP